MDRQKGELKMLEFMWLFVDLKIEIYIQNIDLRKSKKSLYDLLIDCLMFP